MATKAAFVAPWSDSADHHLSSYTQDLTRRNNNATKYDVKITDEDKVTQLITCIYEADLLEDLVMEKWEESGNRSWTNTVKHLVKEYRVVNIAAEQQDTNLPPRSEKTIDPPSKMPHVPPHPDPPRRTMEALVYTL